MLQCIMYQLTGTSKKTGVIQDLTSINKSEFKKKESQWTKAFHLVESQPLSLPTSQSLIKASPQFTSGSRGSFVRKGLV